MPIWNNRKQNLPLTKGLQKQHATKHSQNDVKSNKRMLAPVCVSGPMFSLILLFVQGTNHLTISCDVVGSFAPTHTLLGLLGTSGPTELTSVSAGRLDSTRLLFWHKWPIPPTSVGWGHKWPKVVWISCTVFGHLHGEHLTQEAQSKRWDPQGCLSALFYRGRVRPASTIAMTTTKWLLRGRSAS